MTTTTAEPLTWQHVRKWAESLPEDWTARPGSCVECPIAKYLRNIFPNNNWAVGTYTAVPDANYRGGEIGMPKWVAFFIECVDVHSMPISKARLIELLERCKPEEEAPNA